MNSERPQTILTDILNALDRQAGDLQTQADRLRDAHDYSAEFPAEDARLLREAAALLRNHAQEVPTRETLAGLLAAVYWGQYATNDDKRRLDRAVESALQGFDIGKHEFATPSPESKAPQPPVPTDDKQNGWFPL